MTSYRVFQILAALLVCAFTLLGTALFDIETFWWLLVSLCTVWSGLVLMVHR